MAPRAGSTGAAGRARARRSSSNAGRQHRPQRRRQPALHLRPLAPSLPGAGQFAYAPIGGTRPTDSGTGATGTLISGGTINVELQHRAARAQRTHRRLHQRDVHDERHDRHQQRALLDSGPGASVGCTGNGCQSAVAGNFAGFFAGPGGSGIGLDYFFNTRGGGVIEGVVGYRRCVGARRAERVRGRYGPRRRAARVPIGPRRRPRRHGPSSRRHVGAAACKECHAAAYDAWARSRHRLAMQVADP